MAMILASQSPRRRELLEMLGLEFEIRPAKGGEHPPEGAGPEETVLALAGAKAEEIAEHSAENDDHNSRGHHRLAGRQAPRQAARRSGRGADAPCALGPGA